MVAKRDSVADLLELTSEVLELESRLRTARLQRRLARTFSTLGPIGLTVLFFTTVFTWGLLDLKRFIITFLPFCLLLTAAAVILYQAQYETTRVPEIELQLALKREQRKARALDLSQEFAYHRNSYRESIQSEIHEFRGESKYYRRIHNYFQAVIIVGALATSTLSSLAVELVQFRWAAAICGFLVGVSAGFTGYFKFKERSSSLQETADSIEQETNAVRLGIGRYRSLDAGIALGEYVEEVEKLKIEQRKREQNLEQPPEGKIK
jgi:hypothetical protein